MATKRQPIPRYGPRVTDPAGRPAKESGAGAVLERVQEVKKRLGLSWPQFFAEPIGMANRTIETRTRATSPTPFTVAELGQICAVRNVRAEYLLLGLEPIFDEEVVATRGEECVPLADALHEHLAGMLRARFGITTEGMADHLPGPSDLLIAVEQGVGDAWEENFTRKVDDRLLVSRSVRDATHNAVCEAWEPPDPSPETIRDLTMKARRPPPRLPDGVMATGERWALEGENLAIKSASAEARRAINDQAQRALPPEETKDR